MPMTPEEYAEQQAALKAAWRAGKLIITAKAAPGPFGDHTIACVVPREVFAEDLRMFLALSPMKRRALGDEFKRKMGVTMVAPGISLEEARTFVDNLPGLFMLVLVNRDADLSAAKIEWCRLEISPDESLPWYERGMLDPALGEELGVADIMRVPPEQRRH